MENELKAEPRLKEARHLAAAICKRAGMEPPIQLNKIYQLAKAQFDLIITGAGKDILGDKIDAMVSRDGDQVTILYNKSHHPHRQRFSVAHELGHLYMGHVHGGGSVIDLDSTNFHEIEANQFAAHLLMPPSDIKKRVKGGMNSPQELAKFYQVSQDAIWWQINKNGILNLITR